METKTKTTTKTKTPRVKRKEAEFNVIYHDFNANEFIPYNIFKYLNSEYDKLPKVKQSEIRDNFDKCKEFIIYESRYKWWARCEYEIILTDWPCRIKSEKVDIFWQISKNIDTITKLFMDQWKQ